MTTMKRKLTNCFKYLKGDAVVISQIHDTLIIDVGNKSAEEVKTLASTFFKSAYNLTNKLK